MAVLGCQVKEEDLMQSVEVRQAPFFSPLLHRYTLQEFWALAEPEDRCHYDLIGGSLFMVPPPAPPHGKLDARVAASLHYYLQSNNVLGEVHHPREAIYVDEEMGTYLEPDMMYVSEALSQQMGQKRTSADIVFEYSSKSTAVYDRTTKADTYLALGVRELWIVNTATMTIEVRYASSYEGQPVWEGWRYSKGDRAESKVLPGWRVSVAELFEGLTEE
jgi:Uma2 family endonuclease